MDWKLLTLCLFLSASALAASRVQICAATYPGAVCGSQFDCLGTTAGNTVIVCWKTNGAGTGFSMAGGGVTWTLAGTGAKNASGGGAYCFYSQSVPGGDLTGLQLSCSGANFIGYQAIEYTGLGAFDVASATAPAVITGATVRSDAFTTTDTGLIFAFWGNQQNSGPYTAAGTNYTGVSAQNGSYQASEEWLGAAAGPHTATMVLTSNGNANAMTVLAFKNQPTVANSPAGLFWGEW